MLTWLFSLIFAKFRFQIMFLLRRSQQLLPKMAHLHLLLLYFTKPSFTMFFLCHFNATLWFSNQKKKHNTKDFLSHTLMPFKFRTISPFTCRLLRLSLYQILYNIAISEPCRDLNIKKIFTSYNLLKINSHSLCIKHSKGAPQTPSTLWFVGILPIIRI